MESHPLTRTNVEPVNCAPYLAELTDSNPNTRAGECLSVFLAAGEIAAECLSDPEVVSERAAPGHWRLLGVDAVRRRAYYARIEHSRQFGCDAFTRASESRIQPPIS